MWIFDQQRNMQQVLIRRVSVSGPTPFAEGFAMITGHNDHGVVIEIMLAKPANQVADLRIHVGDTSVILRCCMWTIAGGNWTADTDLLLHDIEVVCRHGAVLSWVKT